MLVLTRRKDQRIVIGDDVVITVLEVKGDTVRIGIEAPRSVQVHREEVHEALAQANREALLRSDPAGSTGPLPALPMPPVRPGPRPGPLAARPGPRPGPPPTG